MRKILLFSILCIVLILSSCGGNAETAETATEEVTVTTEKTYFQEGERITITSLKDWSRFNFDGNFSDNCKDFLRMFIENTSKFTEFDTVKLSDWEITRDPKVYGNDLAFNFTVTESSLDALPVGTYKTTVKDAVDCYITFDGYDPTTINDGLSDVSLYAGVVCDWINATCSWSFPEYGKATDEMQLLFLNYYIDRYGDGTKIANDDFVSYVYDTLGVNVNEEIFNDNYTVENKTLYIKREEKNGNTAFSIINESVKSSVTTVTVQFFADCNKFIKSDVVEYDIGENGELFRCERIYFSDYEPYGVTNVFDEKS